jgi:hypothetical protein
LYSQPAMTISLNRLRLSFRILIVVLGFLQAWAGRFFIEPDGVNYLDVAQAYTRHDWPHAINGYWSPLYSWLLAIIDITFHPSPYWESTYLHLLNFLLFLLALIAFEFFLRRLLALINSLFPELDDEFARPAWAWWVLGYTAFAVCTLRVITLSNDTPDMALAAVIFLATGMLIDLRQFERSAVRYALLGGVLGIAYLTKGVMFPLFFVFAFSVAFARGAKKIDLRALATLVGFLVVSLPFAGALSYVKGQFTFGETGKVAYIHEVIHADEHKVEMVKRLTREKGGRWNGYVDYLPKKLTDDPPAYIYATPYAFATYPALYDPSYPWTGRSPRFKLGEQIRAVGRAAASFFHMLSTEKQWVAGWLVLAFVAGGRKRARERLAVLWFVWLPPLVTLGLYSLVLVEPRYAAVWITILWLVLFAAVDWPQAAGIRSVGAAVVLAIAITSGVAVIKGGFDSIGECIRKEPHVEFEIGQSLLGMGLRSGDEVAFLGHTTLPYYWAELSGLRVMGDVQVDDLHSYWIAAPQKRHEIAERFRENGIKAMVVFGTPQVTDRWQAIGGSGYYVQFLNAGSGDSAASREPGAQSR